MNGRAKPPGPDPAASAGAAGSSFGATVLTLSALAIFLYFIRYILIPFVIAGALAFILSIPIGFLSRKAAIPRAVMALLIYVLLLAALAAIGFALYPTMASEAGLFASDLKGALIKVISGLAKGDEIHVLGSAYNAGQLADQAQAALRNWIAQPENVFRVTAAGFSSIFAAFLCAVLLFYFLLGGEQLVSSLVALAPKSERPLIQTILNRVSPVLRRYFLGVAIVVAYAGVAAYIGLGPILGIRHALFLAAATGFLELIPVVGPLASGVLAGFVALQGATNVWDIAKYIVYAIALRLSIDQLIGPLVLGRAASLSPVTVIFCFLAGGLLYGIVGVILAVPVALTLRITLKTIHGEFEDLK